MYSNINLHSEVLSNDLNPFDEESEDEQGEYTESLCVARNVSATRCQDVVENVKNRKREALGMGKQGCQTFQQKRS